MSSPTARTLAECRKRGWVAQVVERFNIYAKVRQDLFDVIDVVAIVPGEGILGIQACAMASRAARVDKCEASDKAKAWVKAGAMLQVWSWRKLKVKRGGKRALWQLDVTEISLTDNAMSAASESEPAQ